MNKIITLTPNQNSLSGKFRAGDIVLVKCDAVTQAFSIQVPDAKTARDVMFYFKKIDSSANVITLTTLHTQTIDDESTVEISTQHKTVGLISDMINYNRIDYEILSNVYPAIDDTYYLGKNDDDSPLAWKGLILKDQAGTGKYYRLEVSGDALQITDLTD